jgi:7-keto-8-aminopelargonate synthetase-like enzyme
MDGDEAPLALYAEMCRKYQAALIVDEAHAVGIYGERGSGLIEAKRAASRGTHSYPSIRRVKRSASRARLSRDRKTRSNI